MSRLKGLACDRLGKTISFYSVGGHIAGGRAARLARTSRAARQPVNAMAHDFSRSVRLRASSKTLRPVCLWSCYVKSEPSPVLWPRSLAAEGEALDGHGVAYLQRTARERKNVFAALIEVVKTHTLGQISHAFYDVDEEYRRNM